MCFLQRNERAAELKVFRLRVSKAKLKFSDLGLGLRSVNLLKDLSVRNELSAGTRRGLKRGTFYVNILLCQVIFARKLPRILLQADVWLFWSN